MKIILSLLFLFFYAPLCLAATAKNHTRLSASLGGLTWGNGFLSFGYDQTGVIPKPRWSVGGELTILNNGVMITPRALLWQKNTLTGFYGGPIASIGIIQQGTWQPALHTGYDSMFIGVGAEGGYAYRAPSRFDFGGGLDVEASNYGLWIAFKLTVGYRIR